jgi:hypothetical protein
MIVDPDSVDPDPAFQVNPDPDLMTKNLKEKNRDENFFNIFLLQEKPLALKTEHTAL